MPGERDTVHATQSRGFHRLHCLLHERLQAVSEVLGCSVETEHEFVVLLRYQVDLVLEIFGL